LAQALEDLRLAAMPPLVLALPDNVRYKELLLGNAFDARSWTAVPRVGNLERLIDTGCDAFLEDMVAFHKIPEQLILISVEQDEAGRHRFVSLASAKMQLASRSEQVGCIEEEQAKAYRDESNAVLLYARPVQEASSAFEAQMSPAVPLRSRVSDGELCPHSTPWARNYTVIPDLSLGPTQRLILCDEATLTRVLPAERIFEHLKLIVNCHESSQTEGKYKVGSCSSKDPPKAIFQAVHQWHGLNDADMNNVNDFIQRSMWDQLQEGTVAVHCLAGIHRAACIVACHYLWRHYTLGHRDIPCDASVIYARLKGVRPAVSPAYTHVLQKYEAYLKRQSLK
jgi:predicted protein tyrosine phosphatase